MTRVLVIAPHMDDEVLGPGATIARHVAQGDEVAVCIVANRAYDHRYESDAIEAEKAAMARAKKILSYHHLYFLDLPDEQLDRAVIEIVKPLERVFAEMHPERVYLCHRGDLNQDHRAVFHAGLICSRPYSSHRVKQVVCYEIPSTTEQGAIFAETAFLPNYYVNIEQFLDTKIKAFSEYQREVREFPHPRSSKALRALAIKRGTEVGLSAAEAFVLLRDIWE